MIKGKTWVYAVLALGGGFLGGLAAVQLAPNAAEAARAAKSVTAHEFVVVDHDGTTRARLSVATGGVADLEMLDGQRRDRAELRVSENGLASLGFYGDQGEREVLISEAPGKRSGITIYGSGRMLAALTVNHNNESNLTLYDPKTGRARVGLGVAADGPPALAMFDAAGRDRAELHVRPDGRPGLALADENGKTIAGLPEKAAVVSQPAD